MLGSLGIFLGRRGRLDVWRLLLLGFSLVFFVFGGAVRHKKENDVGIVEVLKA